MRQSKALNWATQGGFELRHRLRQGQTSSKSAAGDSLRLFGELAQRKQLATTEAPAPRPIDWF
jgi:hypothetical protein